MLVTNHVLSGALLGAVLRAPSASFLAGIGSHFALDAVPHWGDLDDDEFLPVAVRDGLAGLAAMALLTRLAPAHRRLAVVAGMLGAALPDLDKPGRVFLGRSPFPRRLDEFHVQIQRESRSRLPQELLVTAALGLAAVRLLRRAGA